MTKETYVQPLMIEIGSFEEITQAAGAGTRLDQAFSNDTPVVELTFS